MNIREDILAVLENAEYVDMHIHLDEYSSADLDGKILYIGNSIDRFSYNQTLELAAECPNVIALPGIHPSRAVCADFPRAVLEQIIKRSALAGEIGLDFHWEEDRSSYPRQIEIFEMQLDLCKKYGSIPSIHTKGAEKEVLRMIRTWGIEKSIIHWYSGPDELLEKFLEQGCYFTIGPDILNGSSDIFGKVPAERMFAETDNPTGVPWATARKSSSTDIIAVYRALAAALKIGEEELIGIFRKNLSDLLSVSPSLSSL